MRKTLLLTILTAICSSSLPVFAFEFSFSPEQLLEAFSRLSSLRSSLLPDEIGQYVREITEALSNSLENQDLNLEVVYGEMGFPDLADLETQIQEAYQSSEQEAVADVGSNEATRAVTEQYSNTAFTEEGQEAIQQKQEAVAQGVQTSQAQGDEAQTETVTQNILKKMSMQNTQMALLGGTAATELTELNIKQDLANKNLANISASIDSQNLAQNAQLDAALVSSMSLISQSTLRP